MIKKILKHLIYLLRKKYRVVITKDMIYLGREISGYIQLHGLCKNKYLFGYKEG